MRKWRSVVVAVVLVVLAGCSASHPAGGSWGDCSTTVRLHGVVYRPVSTSKTPRAGRSLGSSDYYGCAGRPVPGRTRAVRLLVAAGLDPDVAVLARDRGNDIVYVRQSIRRRDWPAKLKEATRVPRCRAPTSFTGTWVGMNPWTDNYNPAVPYTGSFQARRGTRLQLDQWSVVNLEAKITAATRPVPTAPFLERALVRKPQVAVTTVCRGTAFEVSSIKFAD